MRMIPPIRQAFGRHGPRRWFSGLFTFLFCLLNFFSITGLGFALPTSHAASPWSRTGFQYHKVVHTSGRKTVLRKVSTGVQHHLKTQIRHIALTAPDLGITDTSSAANYTTGATATYTLTVSNGASAGPVLAGPITVTDTTIAPGLSNIVATTSPSGAWTFNTTLNTVTATYAGGYPIQSATTLPIITITGTVPTLPFIPLNNIANVSVPDDANSANNGASTVSMILPGPPPPPDFALTMAHTNVGCALVGSSATFTLTATNGASSGPEALGPITITDTLPAGLSGVTGVGTGWTSTISGTTLTATHAVTSPIAAEASLPTLTVSGTISNPLSINLANSATLAAPGDTNSLNNTANTTVSLCEPDLAIIETTQGLALSS